ncbi:terpene synthase family protein [Streptomyces sp. G45]|uniref:terpene synthase family protein n=1 Tax=Streptomyces sp. G45 TaxID=3406627 RepID=UPI003C2562AB
MHHTKPIDLGSFRFRPRPERQVRASGRRVREWVRARGLTGSPESYDWFCLWDTAHLVGNCYPHAVPGPGMDLAGRMTAVTILLDDQIDESASVGACVEAIAPFLDIVRTGGEEVPRASRPLHHAFAEVLRDSRARASDIWWRRAAGNWEASLISVAHETLNRTLREGPAPYDVFLETRHGSGYMGPFLDILEPAASLEAPALAYYSPQLLLMRRIVEDLGSFVNDVFSAEKETVRGQYDNLVLVLRERGNTTLEEATRQALEIIRERVRRFLALRAELPTVCARLGLSPAETRRGLRYADALEMWVAGLEPWHRTSPRYTQALARRPKDVAWAHEDLLGGREAPPGRRALGGRPPGATSGR